MKVISLNGNSKLALKKSCVAIGIFDGVHRGHQYLIEHTVNAAGRLKAVPVVITFFPHPAHVLRPDLRLDYLMSLEDRLRVLDDLGVELCVLVRFSATFARIEPQRFITDTLVKQLGVKAVFVGADFCFGKDRSGDIALFEGLGRVYGYETHALAGLKEGRAVISSTRIRALIAQGKLAQAALLLGRPFSISGKVIQGSKRGRTLGFPTANIATESQGFPLILPSSGVYAVRVILGSKEYPAIANIGTRPSFENQTTRQHLEVHILDFKKSIYGKDLKVVFIKKLRDERKFPNPQSLIAQIQKDIPRARCAVIET